MFPGGYGTLDELSEILTLKQTGRIQQPMPIVLVGKKYWSKAINFDYFVERKVIDKEDLNLFLMTDYIDQAFEFISCILKEKCLDKPALHI
jgi:predicted Rossmann-fold nucleotide-binding protein